jgi:hypothetical protein
MITVAGSTHLRFTFPAEPPSALAYYSDLRRTLALLPHISIVKEYTPDCYRMLYSTIELGVYRVRLVCDIRVTIDPIAYLLKIEPWEGGERVRSSFGVQSLIAQADYHSQSVFESSAAADFSEARECTCARSEIDYRLKLEAYLPVPLGARFMPNSLLNRIARTITDARIHEIASGFIEKSVAAYTPKES